jgi:hypothetical protein
MLSTVHQQLLCSREVRAGSTPHHRMQLAMTNAALCRGQYDPAQLADEEAGFVYRYAYNGAGEAATWFSSRNYLVVDLAAGPTTYGPLISQGGAVTPQGLPSIKVMTV